MKTSWRKILSFNNFVAGFKAGEQVFPGWLALHPEESKLNYAIKRVVAQVAKINEAIQVKFENLDIDNCAIDANQVILRNPDGTLAFTKEGLKVRNAARAALLDAEDIEIEPCYATEIPESLTEQEREFFIVFVIKEEEKLSAVA